MAGAKKSQSQNQSSQNQSSQNQIEYVEFSKIAKPITIQQNRIKIEKLIDEEFLIEKVAFLNSKFRDGKYALVTINFNNNEYVFTTSSAVLLKQLELIKNTIEQLKLPIKVKLRKVKRYYTFE